MTTSINYTKILLSVTVIAFVSAAVFGGTRAFFSDTETSTGNTFMAGDIDLQIDNESYAIDYNIPGYDNPTGEFVASPNTSWELADLTVEKFFNFVDLKPGDYGEDTISIHVGSNDAWVCAAARITADNDNDITEPEDEEDGSNSDGFDGTDDGDLDSELNFAFWVDDGDNVLEADEVDSIFADGSLDGLGQLGPIALADSEGSMFDGGPIPGGETVYVAKGWCFGDMTPEPLDQDDRDDLGPLGLDMAPGGVDDNFDRGTGFTCNGAGATNIAQTDSVEGDLEFYAEQARNNGEFMCSDWQPQFIGQEPPRETVGTVLGDYVGPDPQNVEECDFVATDDASLGSALGSANPNDTICVEDGTYAGPVDITVDGLSLLAVNPAVNTAVINGGVIIDAPNVTVSGFQVIPGNTEGSTAGFYLKEPADNAVISYNDIDGTGVGGAPLGVVNVTGADIDSVLITRNSIHDLTTGVYTNPHPSDTWTISYNDFADNTAGVGQWNGADILYNEFSSTLGVIEAIGVDNAWDSNGGVVNFNNFLNDVEFNTYTSITGTINAENNFFSSGGAAQVDETNGDVDYDPEEVSAFPHN